MTAQRCAGAAFDEPLPVREFPGSGDPSVLLPPLNDATRPFHEALQRRRLVLHTCLGCQLPRFPVAPVCPYCLSDAVAWRPARPYGVVHSWIRFHRSYLPAFRDLLPYSVVDVRLADGPLLFGRWLDPEVTPAHGMPAEVTLERWPNAVLVPAFSQMPHGRLT